MIDRAAETDWLRSHLTENGEGLLVLYGRRRVGKTTLVTSVFDTLQQPTFYYLCDERGTTQNARRFAEQCADTLDDIPPDVDGFVDAFEYLARRLEEPAVVALDEFSYLVDEDDTIPSVFQTVVDETLNGTGISLVLLGSSISMMEEGVLSYESPLYGRRTGQWRMEPMTLGDAAGFFPDYDAIELVEAYSILGGVPAYLEQFDPDQSLLDNVERAILSKGAFLYEEPEFLLRQELREPPTYMAILEAIAAGATRVSEIGNEIGRDASSLSRYLQNLTRIGVVERETPVTDPDGRGVYRITDQFLRFWFRYVLPNRVTLEQGHTEPVRDAIEETLAEHASWTFEDVCRQAVRTAAFPVSCSRVGRWWYGSDELDVAGIDEQTDTLVFGECKWTSDVVGRGLLDGLEALEDEVRWHGNDRSVMYTLFARTGFTETVRDIAAEREDLLLFTPVDVLELFDRPRSD
jgi:AAA+ ATPase superfamily predicted ATPase